MTSGFALAASEANALCDSLNTQLEFLQRKVGTTWAAWSTNVKLNTSSFPDQSKWWFYDRVNSTAYHMSHCASANCGDVN
jgi:hypothetical protein